MYFKIVAENISDRIFNVAQNEVFHEGVVLRTVKYVGDKRIIHCQCDSFYDIARIVSTLETDHKGFVSFVENSFGEYIPFRNIPLKKTNYFSRYTLRLVS